MSAVWRQVSGLCCLLAVLLASAGWSQTARSGVYRIELSATPRQVPADGQTQARLRVEVRDQGGRFAPDGTQFVAHTTLGLLSTGSTGRQQSLTARTTGGFAFLFVTSTEPGSASITVRVADSRNLLVVDFLPEGETAQPDARVVDVSGAWVGYNTDMGLIEARDRAQARFGRLVFQAGGVLQVDINNLTLKAQEVVITRGDQRLEGADVYFDLAARRGVLRRFGAETVERVTFDALNLQPGGEPDWEVPLDAFRACTDETETWMLARSISYFLREKVVLRHASLWVQGQRIFSFPPYWIIGLPGYAGASNTQSLGVTSSGGLAVDFPFFYRVTDAATGSVKVQRGARSSAVTSRAGWSLALQEEYRTASGVTGTVQFSGLPRSDWGVDWRDTRPFSGSGTSYFNLALPDHRSVLADANLLDYHRNGRLSLRAYYDRPVYYEPSYGLVGDWLSDPRPIGNHNLSYRLGTSAGLRRYTGETSHVFVNETYSELSLGSRSMGRKTRLLPQVTNVFSWDSSGYRENSLRGEVRLEHGFTNSVRGGLEYSAEWRQGYTPTEGVEQVVGLDLRANHGSKWISYLTSTYNLTKTDTYGYAGFDYYLNNKWRWGLAGTYYDFSATRYSDLEISLGRKFGDREVSVLYSTDTGRVSLGLGGFGYF